MIIGVIWGLYRRYIGGNGKNMETNVGARVWGLGLRVYQLWCLGLAIS